MFVDIATRENGINQHFRFGRDPEYDSQSANADLTFIPSVDETVGRLDRICQCLKQSVVDALSHVVV
jgi:hypothetical protein